MARDDFVGREWYLSRIRDADVTPGGFLIISGRPGSGKTRLLDELDEEVRKLGGSVIHLRCDGSWVPGHGGGLPPGEAAPLDEDAEIRRFDLLMQGIEHKGDTLDAAVAALGTKAQRSPAWGDGSADEGHPGWGDSRPVRRASWRETTGGASLTAEDASLEQIIEQLAEGISRRARDLSQQEDRPGTRRRLAVLVDDFDLLAGRPLGDWIMQMLALTRNTTIMLAHRDFPPGREPEMPPHAARRRLRDLEPDDVAAYLGKRLRDDPDVARAFPVVWNFTRGHPGALALATDFINRTTDGRERALRTIGQLGVLAGESAGQRQELVEGILAGESGGQLQELVESTFDAIGDRQLRDALAALCVTPHFDEPLLARLPDMDERRARDLIGQISEFSFVTDVIGDDGDSRFLTISDYVRDIGQARLGDDHRAPRRQQIHRVAAGYFHELVLAARAQGDDTWTQAWYRYEDPDFVSLVKDWLYHVGRLTGRDRRQARLEIAEIFLDLFWWWGCYLHFPFCQDILDDWMSVVSTAEGDGPGPQEPGGADSQLDRQWGQALHDLYDHYPREGRLEDATPEQWRKLRQALLFLKSSLPEHRERRSRWMRARRSRMFPGRAGAAGQPERPGASQVRGLLAGYLAEATAYLDPGNADIDQLLDEALDQFAGAGEDGDYATTWMRYTRGEVALRRGQTRRAIALARAARKHATEDGIDHEVTSNLHRTCADAHWARGERGAALDGHARAAAHAYATQAESGHGPDPYTRAFLGEMTSRCVERLASLHADGGADGRAVLHSACERIRAFFAPYWSEVGAAPVPDIAAAVDRALAEGRQDTVAALLLPPQPDLKNPGYYKVTCESVVRAMDGELARLPGTPLPAARR